MKSTQRNNNKAITIAIAYAVFVLALGGFFNYVIPYDPSPATSPTILMYVFWLLLYAPLVLFTTISDWKIINFGFSGNYRIFIVTLPFLFFFALFTILNKESVAWQSGLIEAFARTGEEVFFRGFLFLLVLKIFNNKEKPEIWAVLISSLAFTLVHTQIFQNSYFLETNLNRPYLISIRLINLFLNSVLFAFIRHWSKSILPSVIFHCISKGGVFTLPFCIAFYFGIAFIAHKRGEVVSFEFDKKQNAT